MRRLSRNAARRIALAAQGFAAPEYWAHEASLLPLDLQPLLRWRMARAERGEGVWKGLTPFAGERRPQAEAILRRIRDEGPLAASDLDAVKAHPRGNLAAALAEALPRA